MEKIDLHIHTNLSDRDYDIKNIIQYSKVNNCFKIAITDHEVIRDYQNIGIKENINIINGIEFNSSEKGLHILGYGIEDIDNMSKYANNLHQENEWITFELVNKLEEKGIDISIEKLIKYLRQNNLIYTYLDKRHLLKYLISKEFAKDVYDTYKRLIVRGTELYSIKKNIIKMK